MAQVLDDPRRRRLASVGDRVPPHSLAAEESLLGAMLLSRDAIVAAVEIQLRPDDFYKPAHGHIFEALTSLYAQGEPADPVTVAEELRRADLLDAIGGPAVLVSLQAGTPAISNAGRYARIVEEHALLRRLIGVAGEIAEIGYGLPDDVVAAIDEAEALVFGVAQRRVTDSLAPLRDLLEAHLDHIEALYERNETITGIPTGYLDLDHQLAGLQPSNLVIVGGRPGTGKALALDTPLVTPTGWTTMGDVQVGDRLLDERGHACLVTFTTPVQLDRACFEVVLDDGSVLVADADHQWFAYDFPAWKSLRAAHDRLGRPPANPSFARDQTAKRRRPRVVTTRQMLDEGLTRSDGRPNWYLLPSDALELPEADLPVDPYVLGCWLGDGRSSGSELTIGAPDVDHFRSELAAAGYPLGSRQALQWATVPVAGKGARQGDAGPHRVLTRELQQVGLLGGAVKHIPGIYLRASVKQRKALLAGLMDTDGTASARHASIELCLTNEHLLRQAHELVCSLGHRPGPVRRRSVRLPGGRVSGAWRMAWTPPEQVFRLPRKADRLAVRSAGRRYGRAGRRTVSAIRPVASVPVRCITVDSPSSLYLAGRTMVPTHNTSFALGIAAHAGLEAHKPVLVFSLEMSHRELTQRLLCSEARVDATRMRNGRLLETDWPKISHAVGRLAEAPIYIDDNPHLTVMEIRAKARRLKSRSGLGLVVIDYMQLMSGRSNAENRQVEVSEISRGLKILARELEVPVVALSQLSRNLENRADKRPILADLRESGCLTADTRLLRADTGEEVLLGELVLSQEQPLVWSVDDRHRLVARRLTRAFPSGIKPVFRLRLASGRHLRASANHRFLTSAGWCRLEELAPGTPLAVPGRVPPPLSGPLSEEGVGLERDLVLAGGRARLQPVTRRTHRRMAAMVERAEPSRPVIPDVLWDAIVQLVPCGSEPTFDATVGGTHNFVANGIVAHNSLEQDADVVIFLYRDEVYNRDSPDRGTAEIIVAKHRNGPIGTTQLAFLDHYTRFANMAKGV